MKPIPKIPSKKFKTIFKKAKRIGRDSGIEVCGLIISNGFFFDLLETRNKSKKPGSFQFYPSEGRRIEKAVKILGYEIVGTFHSHPVGLPEPGEIDIKYSEENDCMLIFDCLGSEAKMWNIKKGKAKEIKYELF